MSHQLASIAPTATSRPVTHSSTPPPPPLPSMIGVGNVPGCLRGADPTTYLRARHASVLRVDINPWYANGAAVPCLKDAVSAGFKVNLAIAWWGDWQPARIEAFYREQLGYYAPYVWAVSIGNEEELLGLHNIATSGTRYATDWRAVEPIVAAMAPRAIRVAGEISPWGFKYLQDAFASGLPGAQAVAAHPYAFNNCFSIPAFEAWARSLRLPVWFTEGLSGLDTTPYTRSLSGLRGASLAAMWLNANEAAQTALN